MELAKGMQVYLKRTGNNARHGDTEPVEAVVQKVGRKYFEVGFTMDDKFPIKFHLEDKREVSNYSANWLFYENLQKLRDDEESEQLLREIRKAFDIFGGHSFTVHQLRAIKEVISPKGSDPTE